MGLDRFSEGQKGIYLIPQGSKGTLTGCWVPCQIGCLAIRKMKGNATGSSTRTPPGWRQKTNQDGLLD